MEFEMLDAEPAGKTIIKVVGVGGAGGVGATAVAIDFWLISQAAISATALAGNAVA